MKKSRGRKDIEWRTDFTDEHDFQRWSVARLRYLGYIVRVTSTNVRGRRQHRGMADVPVRNRSWDKGLWKHFEFKNPNGHGRFSLEQEESVLNGDVIPVLHWKDITDSLGIDYSEQMGIIL